MSTKPATAAPAPALNGPPPLSDEFPAIVPGGYLCLAWVLTGKRVLIVGGGPVAAGKSAVLANTERRRADTRLRGAARTQGDW